MACSPSPCPRPSSRSRGRSRCAPERASEEGRTDHGDRSPYRVAEGGKASAPAAPERTRPGPVFSPPVDIFESENAITVLADMPGVKAQDLAIDLRDDVLTLTGRVTAPERDGETGVLHEYDTGTFYRQFTLAETIDQAKIDARLTNGVLRLELPKVERARPRQIMVRTS